MKTFFIGLSGALLLFGCGKEAVKQTVQEPRLMQTWETACSNDSVGWIPGVSVRSFLSFSGDKFTEVQKLYTGDACATQVGEGKSTGTFVLGAENAVNGSRPITFNYQESSVTITDETVRKVFETGSLCGINAWVLNVPTKVTGNSNQATCIAKNAPSAAYDILKVVNGNQLLLGVPGIAARSETEAQRPTELNTAKPYTPSQVKLE